MFSNKKLIIVLFLAFGALYAPGLFWGMPSEFVPEIDSEFPSGPFNMLAHWRDPSFVSNYPAFHKFLMLPLYAVVLAALKAAGQLASFSSSWPYGFRNPALAMTLLIVVTRFVSLVMGAGAICVAGVMVNRIAARLDGYRRLLPFAPLLAFGLSGVVAYYSRTSNYDAPQLFWWSLSFCFLWRYCIDDSRRRRDLVLSALFGALATATKDQMLFFVAGSSLLLFAFPAKGKTVKEKARLFAMYALCALGFYIVAAVLVAPQHWVTHMKQVLLLNITSGTFVMPEEGSHGQLALFLESVQCLSHIISPAGIALALGGFALLLAKKNFKTAIFIGVPIIITYVFMFARIRFVFERYMLNYAFLAAIIIAWGIYYALEYGAVWNRKFFGPALALLLCCWPLQQLVFGFVPVTYAQCHDVKRQLAAVLPSLVRDGDTLSWQGSVLTLPNARVYAAHRFAIPESVSVHSSRMGHVFAHEAIAPRRFTLSDHDLFAAEQYQKDIDRWNGRDWVDTAGLRLVAMVKNPRFIEKNIHVYTAADRARTFRISPRYYLYQRMPADR